MTKSIPLEAGQKFGRLTVIKLDHIKYRQRLKNNKEFIENLEFYLCKCDCGKNHIVKKECLKSGKTQSCGCLKKEKIKNLMTVHGLSNTRIFNIFFHIKQRCYNKNNRHYKDYGGRGINIYDEWIDNPKLFYDWAMANGYKDNLTIDRINNNGNYEPSNCRWADMTIQNQNKRNNINIIYNNETHCLKDWAKILKLPYKTIHFRFKYCNMSIEDTFNLPIKKGNNQNLRKK